jgi:hypothetical protein
VLTIRGDHGKTIIKLIKNPSYGTDLAKGALPGPSYPLSLTRAARIASGWSGGRKLNHRAGFGFDPISDVAQQGNNSEYLLKDAKTGELGWVTMLVSRNSGTGQINSEMVTPAGYSNAGLLNQSKIYALKDNDPRRTNILTLKGNARNALSRAHPEFFNAGGQIVEFLPISPDMWQAYGEVNNLVIYRIDIPVNVNATPTVYALEANSNIVLPNTPVGTAPQQPQTAVDCGKPNRTVPQIQACMNADTAELARRAAQATNK